MTAVTRIVIGQSHVADCEEVCETLIAGSASELSTAAARANNALIWIVDAAAKPEPGALDELLRTDTTPAVSLPVDGSGAPSDVHIGRFVDEDERLLEAARNRQVPLRHTALVSILCERDAVTEIDPPDPRRYGVYAQNEWTARLFSRHPGILVPASRVSVPRKPRGEWLPALRMLRTPTWRRGEAVRELIRVGAGG